MSLVRESATSLYEQIARQLLDEIDQGLYEPSGKLPSEAALVQRFEVSRVTVRLALAKLEAEGQVERKQGKGTYAVGRQIQHGLDALRSFHEALLLQGLQPTMRLLGRERQALPEALRGVFGEWRDCLLVRRLHLVEGEPVALGRSYLPVALEAVDWAEFERRPAYALLEGLTGQAVSRADLVIRAQPADRELGEALQVRRGTALLVMERTSWFADGRCCDRSTFFIRPERYAFVLSSVFRPDAQR